MARYYQCRRNPFRGASWLPRFPHCAIGNASSDPSSSSIHPSPTVSSSPSFSSAGAETRAQPLRFDKDDGCTRRQNRKPNSAYEQWTSVVITATILRKVNCCGDRRLPANILLELIVTFKCECFSHLKRLMFTMAQKKT